MNFNLNLQVDKAMSKLSESKVLRRWTYCICLLVIVGITIWQLAPVLQAIASLIKVMK